MSDYEREGWNIAGCIPDEPLDAPDPLFDDLDDDPVGEVL